MSELLETVLSEVLDLRNVTESKVFRQKPPAPTEEAVQPSPMDILSTLNVYHFIGDAAQLPAEHGH